jgi:hypothetical protein
VAIDFYGQFARTNFHIPGFQCLQDQPPETLPRATKAKILNGEKHPRAKLSSRQVRAIRYAFRSATDRALAKMFGVSAGAMSHIRTGKSYRWIPTHRCKLLTRFLLMVSCISILGLLTMILVCLLRHFSAGVKANLAKARAEIAAELEAKQAAKEALAAEEPGDRWWI